MANMKYHTGSKWEHSTHQTEDPVHAAADRQSDELAEDREGGDGILHRAWLNNLPVNFSWSA